MKKLAILVSGRGSNMSAIIDACEQGRISASVEIVLSNNADAKALSIAKEKRINTVYISSQTHTNSEQLDAVMRNTLLKHNIDLIILAGFMKKIGPKVLSEFEGKILNIHPSLLPKYGGKGFYGMNIHRAVVDAGDKESGATIHLVCGDYDDGKILAQETVTLNEEDTPESLAKKILKIEHGLYVKTIQEIIEERIIL
jgi:phosphoribosylglycinamide formyltransferase-1